MTLRTKFSLIILSATLAFYAGFGAWISTRAQQPANDPNAQLRIFDNVLQHIQNDYVDEPNMEKVRAGALRGLAYGLDPYSTYLTADQVKEFNDNSRKNDVGIGAELSQVASYLYVVAPMKGSPADVAGIHSGDIIEYIDGKATRDISLYDAKQLLNGAAGSEVKLRVLRANARPLTVSVKRSSFRAPAAEARMEAGKIGIVKINSLGDGEGADVRTRVQELAKQGVQKIVLDLRDTAGGSLTEGVAVANLFVKDGNIAQTIGRENKSLKTFTADPKAFVFGGPVIAIINNGTAGASEIVASALIERNRGQVIGEKSFGAGTEQQLFSLRDGDGLLLTVVKWASGSAKPFLGEDRSKSGISPSVEVKAPELADAVSPDDLSGNDDDAKPGQPADKQTAAPEQKAVEDVQLKKALELLRENKPVAAPKAA
ncbi:MAG TPA: S41 family peptidase [Pyrinomonadaceae bacterium]|jgi:carboxyl-terminal processing protease|nr:S41 family peptidase [Pyrinomonadaceae bacterium]